MIYMLKGTEYIPNIRGLPKVHRLNNAIQTNAILIASVQTACSMTFISFFTKL